MSAIWSAPSPESRDAARRLSERLDAWPIGARPADPHGFCAEVAPYILPLMFGAVEREPDILAAQPTYRLYSADCVSVRLCAGTWLWYALDGSVDGRGLISLWSWRFNCALDDAYAGIVCHMQMIEARPVVARRKQHG